MDLILLEKVHNLGALGDRVRVKPGYGRNYLIPRGKAAPATESNIVKFEARRAELEKAEAATLAQAQVRATALTALAAVSLTRKGGEEGKLYGSVGTPDIAEALTEAGVATEKHEVRLSNGPLREAGEHEVQIHLHPDINVTVKITIVAEA